VPDGGGARLNLAECYEEWGKLASALNQYSIAEALAKKDGRKDRLKAAASGAAKVKARVATLTILVPDPLRAAPDLQIKVDGEPLGERQWGAPYPVDKGAHSVVASARGYEPRTVRVDIVSDGAATTVSVPALEPVAASPGSTGAPSISTAAPSSSADVPVPPDTGGPKGEGGSSSGARTAVAIAGTTLAVGAIAAGGVSLGLSFVKADERQKAGADPFGREAARTAAQGEATLQNAALWCFVGGGAAAVTTVIVLVATRREVKAPVTAGAIVGPLGPSIWVEGRF
jgi:hypothetical protein